MFFCCWLHAVEGIIWLQVTFRNNNKAFYMRRILLSHKGPSILNPEYSYTHYLSQYAGDENKKHCCGQGEPHKVLYMYRMETDEYTASPRKGPSSKNSIGYFIR